jgi:anti-sigma regulatory factor (Ser/Thr protein kinase)
MEPIKVAFHSHPRWLHVVRILVKEVCRMTSFSRKDISSLVLAVDEACTNIMKHNYRGKTDGVIILECRLKKRDLQFVLKDKGFPMDCKKIRSRSLDEIRPGGLGVFFMKKMMDRVTYQRSNAWNIVTMVKNAKKK